MFKPSKDFFILSVLNLGLPISEETNIYLGGLLTRMLDAEAFSSNQKGVISDKAYSLQYYELAASPQAQAKDYQRLGDILMFYSSAFHKKIRKDGISLELYYSLGSLSYEGAYLRSLKKPIALKELSDKFSLISVNLEKLLILK